MTRPLRQSSASGPGLVLRAAVVSLVAGCATAIAEPPPRAPREEAPAADTDASSPGETTTQLAGTWLDTAEVDQGAPFEIGEDEHGLWIAWDGTRARLERFPDIAEVHDVEPVDRNRPRAALRMKHAAAILDDGSTERHVRLEDARGTLLVDIATVAKEGSAPPVQSPRAVYARRDDFLPNGYEIFFANRSEAGLVKEGVNFGAIIAGPHVAELGTSGKAIFGRIEPKPGLPPHPDHAPGFFVIDSATDGVKTGLDRETWLAELEALGVEAPRLFAPTRKWPKRF